MVYSLRIDNISSDTVLDPKKEALLHQFTDYLLNLMDKEIMPKIHPHWYEAWQAQLASIRTITMEFSGAFCYLHFVDAEVIASNYPFPGVSSKGIYRTSLDESFCLNYRGELFVAVDIIFENGYMIYFDIHDFGNEREELIPSQIDALEPLYSLEQEIKIRQ
ncbi:hypothetical protein [Entomospira culicis]|uniref:Uncharacterized protein n=1 Tax=Entomospira culicis TaxID=2719989 RepID=A0A968GK76_9SPIO|nr:hypothetical protein [Entomospira culicis]NIZ19156.1 hypothetical protein [Entomospira culicis]NIZ69370.1 hypothetical protein [Entomospira culicis]WDI36487.1 hypothetical protein PVA46_03970 [Entomospira culicis]WDI38113.1 hypothetical protein PVA47_03970 [Entomospira culicis]